MESPWPSVEALRGRFLYRPMQRLPERVGGLAANAFVPLDRLPADLILALLHGEDLRFLQHRGIDPWAVALALTRYVSRGGKLVGASTLSQQLAKNFFLHSGRSWRRKLTELVYARLLERTFDKTELLALYVNNIEWGPEIFGIAAASRRYFDVTPERLDALQCAYLVALIPDPTRRAAVLPPLLSMEERFRRIAAALAIARRHPTLTEFFAASPDKRLKELAKIDLRAVLCGFGRTEAARQSSALRRTLDTRFWHLIEEHFQRFETSERP